VVSPALSRASTRCPARSSALNSYAATSTSRACPGTAPRMPTAPRVSSVIVPSGASSNTLRTSCVSVEDGVQRTLTIGAPTSSASAASGSVRKSATVPGAGGWSAPVSVVPPGAAAPTVVAAGSSPGSVAPGDRVTSPSPSGHARGAVPAGGHASAVRRTQAPGG
jgi:hypothetical protein